MSNTNQPELEVATEVPFAEAVEVETAETETVETAAETESTPAPKKKKKGVGYRFTALLLLAITVAAIILPLSVIATAKDNSFAVEQMPMYAVIMTLISGGNAKYLGFLPMLTSTETFGLVASFTLYLFLIALVVGVVLALIALFAGKNGVVRTAAFFLTVAFTLYTISIYAISSLAVKKPLIDYYLVIGMGASLFLYFVMSAIKGKKAWYNLLQYLLTVAFTGSVMLVVVNGYDSIKALLGGSNGDIFKIILLAALAISVAALVIVMMRLPMKKGYPFELICYVLEFLAAGALAYIAFSKQISAVNPYALAAAGCAFVQVLIVTIILIVKKKKNKKAKVIEPVEEPVAEDVAPEAVAYEGGPIPVEMAEVVETPEEPVEAVAVAEPVPAPVETAEYDYYNSRAFDPFIASLTAEERNQFTELFILKYKGTMNELPDYVVGGDNKAFFNKIFIYLGQYRDRIPDGLMAKIYTYSTKL